MTARAHPCVSAAALAEGVATAFLLIVIVGSGIAAERLSDGNAAVALLANALATGAGLFVLILVFAPVCGAHLNPFVTMAVALTNGFAWRAVPFYVTAQIAGAVAGVIIAHGMFDLPLIQTGIHARTGAGQWLAETIATLGLLGIIQGSMNQGTPTAASAIAAYIGSAYWFTASTCFANPAVTIARAFTHTFAGIRPADVGGFIAAQAVGLGIAVAVARLVRRGAPVT